MQRDMLRTILLLSFIIRWCFCKNVEVNLGTTLVAVTYKNGVVAGADTRTSVGSYVSNRFADKMAPILNKAVICRSGSAADTQHLAKQVETEFQARFYRYGGIEPNTIAIANYLKSLVTEKMTASLICAGYHNGGGKIFTIARSGALLEEDQGYAVSGSGSTYILGHIDNFYRKDMSEQEAIDFVVHAIELAIQRDGSSGGFVRIQVVNKEGSRSEVVYPKSNQPLSKLKSEAEILKGFAPPKYTSNISN